MQVADDSFHLIAGLYGLPRRSGKLKELTRFDAAFFGTVPKWAKVMDPQLRMLLEVTYEALIDAGRSLRCPLSLEILKFNCRPNRPMSRMALKSITQLG